MLSTEGPALASSCGQCFNMETYQVSMRQLRAGMILCQLLEGAAGFGPAQVCRWYWGCMLDR